MKKKTNFSSHIFTIIIGVLGLVALVFYLSSNNSLPTLEQYLSKNTISAKETLIHAPNGFIKAELATSSEQLETGLSGRQSLDPGSGMLFVFPVVASRGFWMRNMSFPIDIIWIDKNKTVIGVTKDVDPASYPNIFFPPQPVKYVLELNAGYAEENGIASGTPLTFTI
jgi:uncharacterized membrane protein (UPF0127 family)